MVKVRKPVWLMAYVIVLLLISLNPLTSPKRASSP